MGLFASVQWRSSALSNVPAYGLRVVGRPPEQAKLVCGRVTQTPGDGVARHTDSAGKIRLGRAWEHGWLAVHVPASPEMVGSGPNMLDQLVP